MTHDEDSTASTEAQALSAAAQVPRGARVLLGVLVAVALFVSLHLAVSQEVLPRLVSPGGRLVHVTAGLDSLSTNHVRLASPPGRAWRGAAFSYALEENEALTFVLDRAGDDYLALRLSRLDALESGLLRYRGNELVEHISLGRAPAPEGRVRFDRAGAELTIVVDDERPVTVSSPRPDGDLEVTLFPPSSPDLHRRVALGDVALAGGFAFEADTAMDGLRSPWTLAVIAVALVLLVRRLLADVARRRFPLQLEREPHAIAVVLICLVGLLSALMLVPRVELLMSFTAEERRVFRFVVVLLWTLSFAFLVARERLVARRPEKRGRGVRHVALVPVLYVGFLVVSLVAFVLLFSRIQVRFEPEAELARSGEGHELRVAILGGSSTRGYPFPQLWGGSYPALLEAELTDRGRDAVAWNLGVESATLDYFAERFDDWIRPLAPTHVVVNNVANNAFGSPEAFETRLAALVDRARLLGAEVILVKEPMLETVYQAGRWASVGPFYPVLDTLGANPSVTVLDPISAFTEVRAEFLFMDDVHLTARGHQRLALLLADHLAPEGGMDADAPEPPG